MATAAPPVTARILAIAEIHVPSPYEPDNPLAEADLAGLTTAIIAYGLLEPIRVARRDSGYVLVDGAKRLAACQDAGIAQVPVEIQPGD